MNTAKLTLLCLGLHSLFACQTLKTQPESTNKARAAVKTKAKPDLDKYVTLLATSESLKRKDLTFGMSFESPKVGSLEEAALCLSVLRSCLMHAEEACDLAAIAQSKQLDLTTALKENFYLKNIAAQHLAFQAIEGGVKDNRELHDTLLAVLDANVKAWTPLAQELEAKTSAVDVAKAEEPNKEEASSNNDTAAEAPLVEEEKAKSLPFGPHEFNNEEQLLEHAKDLVAQSKFKEAVELLRKVEAQSVYYSTAQERLHESCNLAVQTLRQNAAKAFQNSLPVAEPKARQAYLKEAESFLQQALELYPEADQIATVQQNLTVIRKNLESLSHSTL